MARKAVQLSRVILGVVLVSTLLALPTNTVAADPTIKNAADMPWPQFLGPSRNGISAEMCLLDAWPEDGPREVWRMKSDVSMGGVAIAKGRLLTMTQKEGKQFVVARDAGTGKPIWQTSVALQYRNRQGDGPRSTCRHQGGPLDLRWLQEGPGIDRGERMGLIERGRCQE